MKKHTKNSQGKYVIKGKTYEMLEGSRAQVHHGTAYKTSGGLTKENIIQNKNGRIVSKRKHTAAKKENRLVKHGYGTKKGVFGAVKLSKSRKMKGGHYNINSGLRPALFSSAKQVVLAPPKPIVITPPKPAPATAKPAPAAPAKPAPAAPAKPAPAPAKPAPAPAKPAPAPAKPAPAPAKPAPAKPAAPNTNNKTQKGGYYGKMLKLHPAPVSSFKNTNMNKHMHKQMHKPMHKQMHKQISML